MTRKLLIGHKWTHPSDYGGFSPDGDYCIATRTRDSSSLERSNYECIYRALNASPYDGGGDSSEERSAVYDWRAGHWACGWVEYLMVRADAPSELLDRAESILAKLDNYPVFNEDHWSELEFNEAAEYWEKASLSERVSLCRDNGESIFAARHSYLPDKVFDSLRD